MHIGGNPKQYYFAEENLQCVARWSCFELLFSVHGSCWCVANVVHIWLCPCQHWLCDVGTTSAHDTKQSHGLGWLSKMPVSSLPAIWHCCWVSELCAVSCRQIASQTNLMMLAGYETTANTLAFCIYLLGQHPHAQQQLLQEVDASRYCHALCADLHSYPYVPGPQARLYVNPHMCLWCLYAYRK